MLGNDAWIEVVAYVPYDSLTLNKQETFMRNKRLFFLVYVFLLVVSSHFACAEDAQSAGAKPLLYGIHVGQDSDFWNQAGEGAKAAAEKLGYDIFYRGGAQTDTDLQRSIFDIALKSGAKGIFIAPNSADRTEDVMRAKQLGIPVVYFDRTMGENPPIASFIGTDNYAAGELAGSELIKKMGEGKPVNVVVFRMDEKVVPTSEREKGFMDAVEKAGYKVVATPFLTSDIGEARTRLQKFLEDPAMPAFNAFFTSSEYNAVAAILTLQMLGKTKDYVHIGFDGGDTIEKAIASGDMYGTIVQQPYEMGYHSVTALDDVLHGRPVEKFIESKTLFVTADNVKTYNSR